MGGGPDGGSVVGVGRRSYIYRLLYPLSPQNFPCLEVLQKEVSVCVAVPVPASTATGEPVLLTVTSPVVYDCLCRENPRQCIYM